MLLTVKEYALWQKVSEQTVRNLIRAGKLPYVRMTPRTTRIDVDKVKKLKPAAAPK